MKLTKNLVNNLKNRETKSGERRTEEGVRVRACHKRVKEQTLLIPLHRNGGFETREREQQGTHGKKNGDSIKLFL